MQQVLLSTTIKIQFKSIAGGNAIIDGSSSNAIEWSIYALDQTFPSPCWLDQLRLTQLVQRLERASITSTCSASPCTIASQSGSWLTNITRASTGNYSINFAAGMFSAIAPTCNIIANGLIATINTNPTTSVVVIDTKTQQAQVRCTIFVQCMGPR